MATIVEPQSKPTPFSPVPRSVAPCHTVTEAERNAALIAHRPALLTAIKLIARAAPLTIARLHKAGLHPHQELLQAQAAALQILSALGERP